MEEGGALLDEAMAASLGGECRAPADGRVHELQHDQRLQPGGGHRAGCAVDPRGGRVHRRYGSPHLYTTCRTYYGTILFETGDWPEAERQLGGRARSARTAERALYGEALARLASSGWRRGASRRPSGC